MKKIRLVEIKSEIGAGARGASLGVDAVKIAALELGSKYFKHYQAVEVSDENHLLLEHVNNPHAKRIGGISVMYERIAKTLGEIIKNGEFPIILSGDHSNAGGTIAGLKMAYPKERLGVIWIDAHADLHSPFTTPSGNVHGMPLATALAEDNLDFQINYPDDKTIENWENLKNIGGISPKIYPEDIIFLGVRDTEDPEDELISNNHIRNYSVEEVRSLGIDKVTRESLTRLNHCDHIYISFDVDCMDSAVSRGTGTPVPDGFTVKEAGDLASRLVQHEKVLCFEMTEINPTLDNQNRMAGYAFEILKKVTNSII